MSEVTTGEAADILGCTRRHVTRLIASGALTPRRRMRRWYLLDRRTVEDYRDRTVSGTR